MVLFGFIFLVSVVALLAVQSMDVECVNRRKPRVHTAMRRIETRAGFPAEPMALRQI